MSRWLGFLRNHVIYYMFVSFVYLPYHSGRLLFPIWHNPITHVWIGFPTCPLSDTPRILSIQITPHRFISIHEGLPRLFLDCKFSLNRIPSCCYTHLPWDYAGWPYTFSQSLQQYWEQYGIVLVSVCARHNLLKSCLQFQLYQRIQRMILLRATQFSMMERRID